MRVYWGPDVCIRRRRRLGPRRSAWLSRSAAYRRRPCRPSPRAAAEQTFDIAAQPLGSALIRFSDATGIQLFFDASLTRGLQSPGVSGALAPSEALSRLLAGSGLTFRFTNATTITLERAPVPPAAGAQSGIQMTPVQVFGARESATGPVPGFVARQSATATKTDTPLLETPQAISVIGREQMINQNAQSVTDAIHYSPGVTANAGTIDTRFDSIRVRGFLAPLYADGLILPSGTTQFGRPRPDPWGLERVEVLRGPSSALYGQIPPGGMINLVSLRPSDTPVHTVELQGTNFGQLQGAVDLGGKANEDGSLLYRLTALAHAGGTQIDNVDDNRVMIQPALTWKPGKDTTFTVLGQFQRDVNGVATQFLPAQGSLWYNPNGMLPASAFLGDPNDNSFTRSQFWLGYQLEHRFNDAITVRQNLRYASVNTNLAAVIATSLQPNQAVVNRVAYSVPELAQNWTLDNQALFKFNTGPLRHNVLAGFDYVWSGGQTKQGIGAAPSLNMFQPVYWQQINQPTVTVSTGQKQNQYGAYLQDQIAFDRWRLTLSGRHDWVDTLTQNFVTYRNVSQAVSAFSGRAGLNYVFDFGLSPYASISSSFQPTIGVDFSGNPLQPTRGTQYEIGIKYQPDNGNVSATAAAYKIIQQNALTADPAHPGFNLQSGEVTVQGLEFDVTASLARGAEPDRLLHLHRRQDHPEQRRRSRQPGRDGAATRGLAVVGLYGPGGAVPRPRLRRRHPLHRQLLRQCTQHPVHPGLRAVRRDAELRPGRAQSAHARRQADAQCQQHRRHALRHDLLERHRLLLRPVPAGDLDHALQLVSRT